MEVKLNQSKYIGSEKKNQTIKVDLSNDKHNILNDSYNLSIDKYGVYLNERYACHKIRLTAQVNLIASNILFNSITEITKDEDSNDCSCLNFYPTTISGTIGKDKYSYEWGGTNIIDCVRDTQITYDGDDSKNYTYHCGIDILNNHILRSKLPYPIYKLNGATNLPSEFNTIQDYLRDSVEQKSYIDSVIQNNITKSDEREKPKASHIYNKNNILSFQETLSKKIEDRNGWLGFVNENKMMTLTSMNKDLGVSRVINNKPNHSFIEFYPDSSCYSLIPYYNKSRYRKEKNWEYCLCYPYSSTTEGISCINEKIDTLKIAYIDENFADSDGKEKTCIYSVSKHGLQVGDLVNIYRSSDNDSVNELAYENVEVNGVVDDYCFYVKLESFICDDWVKIYDTELLESKGISISNTGEYKYRSVVVTPINDYLNVDFFEDEDNLGSQNLSFAKVVNDIQCKYYVRIFSRFPNFESMTGEVNEDTIYGQYDSDTKNIEEYSKIKYEKQSNQIKLGFSKNIYGDDLSQIVYLDDIDIDNIKDNLGRPLTSLYLMFFKTNYGYREWYNGNVKDKNVEHSHCFGKLNCGLKYSDYIDDTKFEDGNISYMHNCVGGKQGFSLKPLTGNDDDEIVYSAQTYFYGDLVEYSDYNCKETVLQKICHRFNTVQRELRNNSELSKRNQFNTSSVNYDEIVRDDNDKDGFMIQTFEYDKYPTNHPEGYYYESNYEIPIRTFSRFVKESIPTYLSILSIIEDNTREYVFTTGEENHINKDDNVYLYDSDKDELYKCEVVNVLSTTKIKLKVYSDDDNENCDGLTKNKNGILKNNYKLYIRYDNIPYYATYLGNSGGIYRWRDVIQNGFEDISDLVEEYPFTNGCLYVNSQINIFLRRQDPDGTRGLFVQPNLNTSILLGTINPIENGTSTSADYSISESEASC
jgi:hypothetical protein